MNLVDSCGWLEYFAGGPNAGFYAAALEDTENLVVPSVCLYEVFKKVLRERGEEEALKAITPMHQGRVVPCDASLAVSAARISVDHDMPMADSMILSTAGAEGATVWTQDAHFKRMPGVEYVEAG